jgi:hypothetical protein
MRHSFVEALLHNLEKRPDLAVSVSRIGYSRTKSERCYIVSLDAARLPSRRASVMSQSLLAKLKLLALPRSARTLKRRPGSYGRGRSVLATIVSAASHVMKNKEIGLFFDSR